MTLKLEVSAYGRVQVSIVEEEIEDAAHCKTLSEVLTIADRDLDSQVMKSSPIKPTCFPQ